MIKIFTLESFLADSNHKSTIFSPAQINFLESNAYTKIIRGKTQFFIKCFVRGKEIRLTPEESVRQMFIRKLIDDYGYKIAQMAVEHPIHFGRETKRADIVIFEPNHPTTEYIIVEIKKPKLKDGKEQLKSYCNATGATMSIWTNGEKISFYHRKDPNYFEDIPDIPNSTQKLKDILHERWKIDDLIEKDKLLRENKTLAGLILEMEDEVLANSGKDVFEEVFKLIYTKLYDEMMSGRDKSRILEFRNYGDTDSGLKDTIQSLFDSAQKKWSGIFPLKTKIELMPSHLAVCVSSLQNVKLFNSNLDVIDDAFEYLMSKSQKGEKGQFFTPRYVIDMCVRMLNPKINETMIDTAAGSCGFPMHTTFYVWKKILDSKGIKQSHLFTAEKKSSECEDYVKENIFAIDFDEKAVRVAKTLNLIAGDGKTNVICLNTLDYGRWHEVIGEINWQKSYNAGFLKLIDLCVEENDYSRFNFDIVMANPPFAGDIKEGPIITKYELGKNSRGKYQSKVGRDILFIERNLNFLKNGGRMAIILPQGRFNNSSDKYIRDFISERCRILAVVGLHGNVFKPHTGTKTSVLFVQKWDEKLCPRRDDYPIFFATMREPSKDNSGEKIFEMSDGKLLRDKNNHTIVKHDLFNHENLTHDGIAEAFIEFAKKERLSFFEKSSFDAAKYQILSEELECTEIFLSEIRSNPISNRIDSEYFLKAYTENISKLKNYKYGYSRLDSYLKRISGGATPLGAQYVEQGVMFLRVQNIMQNYFNLNDVVYITQQQSEAIKRSKLNKNDVLLTITGVSYGKSAVVTENLSGANINQHSVKMELKNFNPYCLSTFLNSKFGKFQSDKYIIGVTRPALDYDSIRNFIIPSFSEEFQKKIEDTILSAQKIERRADENYHAAEKTLSEALNLENFNPTSENITIKSFSASFSLSGRLDAEFYQPKYDDLKKFLENLKTYELGDLVKIFKSIEPGSDCYGTEGTPFIRVSDVNKFGIAEPEIKLAGNYDVSLFPRKNTILLSKDGSIGIAYKVREDLAAITSGALLHLTIKDKSILPDYLTLVLNSEIVQMQAERDSNGAIIKHWKPDDIKKVVIPVVEREIQEKIAAQVAESFRLRSESEKLLFKAKKAVEIAIESGEDVAIKFLGDDNE